MRWNKWVSIVLFGILAACAPQRIAGLKLADSQSPKRLGPGCAARISHVDLNLQKAEVDAALKALAQRNRDDQARLEQGTPSSVGDEDARLDALTNAYDQSVVAVLEPLAMRGHVDAMVRFADDSGLRESAVPAEVERWFELVSCAADLGHPFALDEMTRWYWHQRGDGSIAQIQANRATAMAFANRAALEGSMFAIGRIATYIAGNVHQYPANLPLAQRLIRLCAQTGARNCGEALAGEWVYDPGLSPVDAYAWRSIMADSEPERFGKQRDIALAQLTAEEQVSATQAVSRWRPTPWRDLQGDWRAVEADILVYGKTSTGVLTSCGSSTPWCMTVNSRMSGGEQVGR